MSKKHLCVYIFKIITYSFCLKKWPIQLEYKLSVHSQGYNMYKFQYILIQVISVVRFLSFNDLA